MRVKFGFVIVALSALLYHAECQAEIVSKKHTEIIETNYKEYQLEMGGYQDGIRSREPLGYAPFSVKFEPNKSVEIENIGDTTIVNPKLIINGGRNWGGIDDILASIITDSMTVDERVRAIFEFCKTNIFRFSPDSRDGSDPVKAFNVYGYGTCREITNVLGALLYKTGLDVYKIHLPEHIVTSVYYDNAYHILDADRRVYYLNLDNKTIASSGNLLNDHYLIKRTHVHGISNPDDKIKSELEAAIYRGITATTKYYLNGIFKKTKFHTMDYSLRPGEKIVFNWSNVGKYHGQQKPVPRVWDLICNGKIVYKPKIHLERVKSNGSLIYEIRSPYVIVGGRIKGTLDKKTHPGVGNVYFSYDTKEWTRVPLIFKTGELDFNANIDEFFPPTLNPAPYTYYIKLESVGRKNRGIEEIIFTTDFQVAYLSLPALGLGINHVVYTDETEGRHKLKITHTWEENYANHPPEPPKAPVYPPDNGKAVNIPAEFIWQEAQDEDGDKIVDYHFQLSNRKDMRWPLSANFDKLISHTSSKGIPVYKIPFSGLLNPGEKYYWRVKAKDEAGLWSKWSEGWSFVPSGASLPQELRPEETADMLSLLWDTNSLGEKVEFFEVYGSDEKGFIPSKTEYNVVSSTYYDEDDQFKYSTRRFPPNFIATVKTNRFVIFDPHETQQTRLYAYYRIVAVGKNGSRSGPSDTVEIGRPFIYSKPVYNVQAGSPYKYQLKSVHSIGDLKAVHITKLKRGGSLVGRYTASFAEADNLQFSLLLAPNWLTIKKTDARTALIYGKPPKYNDVGSSWVIALVNDDFMNFDIQAFKIQGDYKNSHFNFIKGSLKFTLKYLQAKFLAKISGPMLRLKRIYWNIHNGMPLSY